MVAGEAALDARATEREQRLLDALGHGGIDGVRVGALRPRVGAVVEPGAGRVALEAMKHPGVSHLDGAEPIHRQRQQRTRVGVGRALRACGDEAGVLHHHDRRDQHGEQQPDDDDPAPAPARAHRCVHHTAVPTTASAAGTRITARKKVPFICRLVRLTLGRS